MIYDNQYRIKWYKQKELYFFNYRNRDFLFHLRIRHLLNGILIPFLRTACELNDFQAYFVTFAFYVSYLVMALPSSAVLKKTGFKNGMALGLWVMAVGSLIFIPAALARNYGLFLTGLFVEGTGSRSAPNPHQILCNNYGPGKVR